MNANPARGEAQLVAGGVGWRLRPSFAALVAAEGELGPLFALVDRAAEGRLSLAGTVALFWHCIDGERPDRAQFGEWVTAAGLAASTPVLRVLMIQILKGR